MRIIIHYAQGCCQPSLSEMFCYSLTLLVSCVSIMKLWTCFSALVSSSFLETTATRRAVQPAPCRERVETQ